MNAVPLTAASASSTASASAGLTRRARLLWLGSWLQQAVRFASGFFLSPLMVRALGIELYGAWVMIQQSTGYLILSDMRPAAALRLAIGTTQHIDDVEARRRQMGSAAIVWVRMLPLIVVVGVGLVWAAPLLIRVSAGHQSALRLAMAISALAVAVDQIAALPGNVLRGLNLDYKATAARTAALVATTVFTAAIILMGGGLVGVAVSSLVGVALGGAAYLQVARRELPWLGFSRPKARELTRFRNMTIWLFLTTLGLLLLNATDLIVVGLLLGPRASAVYAATGAVLRLAVEPLHSMIAAANPGVVGLCGRRQWHRVERVRTELHVLVLFGTFVLAVGVVCLNAAFLRMWLGPGLFGGAATNFLLVLLAIQMVPLRTDMAIVDGMGAYRERSIVMCGGGALTLLIGALGVWICGLPGMALGTLIGRSLVLFGLFWTIRRESGITNNGHFRMLARPVIVGLALTTAALWFPWQPQRVLPFLVAAVLVACVTTALMWGVGLGPDARRILSTRFLEGTRSRSLGLSV